MPSGGARVRSGPPPDPSALRRERKDDATFWVVLPAEGRQGAVPEWPMSEPSDREVQLWARMWARPQALQWEKMQLHYEVASYVRWFAVAEAPGAPVASGVLVQRLADSLGMTIAGLRANRWKISVDELADRRPEEPASEPAEPAENAPRKAGSRSRFQVVDGAAAG